MALSCNKSSCCLAGEDDTGLHIYMHSVKDVTHTWSVEDDTHTTFMQTFNRYTIDESLASVGR